MNGEDRGRARLLTQVVGVLLFAALVLAIIVGLDSAGVQ